jgi:L-ascorbate metabolism protein UlaG (beta-lactamase superfamily)
MLVSLGIALLVSGVFIYYTVAPKLGAKANGKDLDRVKASPQYKNGKFENKIFTPMAAPSFSSLKKILFKREERYPKKALPTASFVAEDFEKTTSKIAYTWFGHSSVLLKLEGKTMLIDPVFGERASLFSSMGPKRFKYSNGVKRSYLPAVDLVLISHDHYDHLEYESILYWKDRVKMFYVPLGVGAHLKSWGVDPEKIIELDWWEERHFEGLGLVFTPTRHFTGRGILNRMQTLWGSWSVLGKDSRVFFSGDSGYFDEFKKVGKELGPFDLAFVENGQYNQDWASIHMMPEESARVGAELRAQYVQPIHWGKFSLSIHSWDEPVKRFLEASKRADYQVLIPAPGELVQWSNRPSNDWWKKG